MQIKVFKKVCKGDGFSFLINDIINMQIKVLLLSYKKYKSHTKK